MVVETDEIFNKLIRHLNTKEGGRVTFIPLNRVKVPHVTYPLETFGVKPLLKELKYHPKYDQAFSQVSNFSINFSVSDDIAIITSSLIAIIPPLI